MQRATRPSMSAFGRDACASIERKAAALLESVARNHTLVDGNNRLAWAATKTFLRMNGGRLRSGPVDGAEKFVLAAAADHLSLDEIESWLADRMTVA